MADTRANCPTNSTNFKEAVCLSAGRVYDSCCDRDCLEDLTVFYSAVDQQTVSSAQSVRLRSAQVVNANIDVQPVNFHKGYYTCNMNLYFYVTSDVIPSGATLPTQLNGLAAFQKQVVLYGSEGAVSTFSSLTPDATIDPNTLNGNAPRCIVETVDPVALSSELYTPATAPIVPAFPQSVIDLLGEPVVAPAEGTQAVEVTLGLFTIVELVRDVQILVPSYDFSFPEKRCIDTTDSPCDVFRSICFPTDDFFPPRPCNLENGGQCQPLNEE